jgi:hypothetical protein
MPIENRLCGPKSADEILASIARFAQRTQRERVGERHL